MKLFTKEITLPFTDLAVVVEYYYYEGCAGCNHMPNGDPGTPPEPPEVDLTRILVNNSCCIMEALSEATLDAVETYLYENTESDNDEF